MNKFSYKYRILNKLEQWGFLSYFNIKSSTTIEKSKFRIPISSGLGLGNLVKQESWMMALLNNLLASNQNNVFLDVGVNIGQTLLKVKTIAPDYEYIGLEPNPFCVTYLHHLIDLNQLRNTTIFPFALADRTAIFQLLFDNDSLIDSSAGIVDVYRKGKFRKMEVIALKANDIPLLKQKKISIIKIDVEGAELEVLKGLSDIIQSNQPYIIIEILPVYSITNKERLTRQGELQELIVNLNYEIHRINEVTSTWHQIKAFEIHSDLALCNLYRPLK